MPRIRNWKNIELCRPDLKARSEPIESLLSETLNWIRIETRFPDMLRVIRVVLSIKAARISASTILRRLGTFSAKTGSTMPSANWAASYWLCAAPYLRPGTASPDQELRSLIQLADQARPEPGATR
jgi:hypothetical protein